MSIIPPLVGKNRKKIEANKVDRETSRNKLLEHLIINCGNYRPVSLERLEERIGSYMTDKERLQKQLRDTQNQVYKSEEEKGRANEEKRKAEVKIRELEAKIEEQTRKSIPSIPKNSGR